MPRKTGKIQSKTTILIIVEGKTEEIYFLNVKSDKDIIDIHGVTVKARIANNSSLKKILQEALKENKSKVYDFVWCVFDRDSIGDNQELHKAINEAEKAGIRIADSLPAFEVWLLSHYEELDGYYKDQYAVISALKKHINGYKKDQKWLRSAKLYSSLKDKIDVAIKNCKTRNNQAHDGDTICNVYKLFEQIKELDK